MIRVAVCGACGRMGKRIIKSVSEAKDMKIVAAIDEPESPKSGKDAGKISGMDRIGVLIVGSEEIDKELKESDADILVDFTIAEAAVRNVKAAADAGIPVVVGTTGFSEKQFSEMAEAIKKSNIPAVISPNMSLGVNVFFKLVENTAKNLKDYDMELVEAHHNQKADVPSGTALTAVKIAANSSGKNFEKDIKYGRSKGEPGKRPKDEIGVHSIRAGSIAGEHNFMFAGANERLEIVHKAQNRQAFVDGVIVAIRYTTKESTPGKIEDMQDVLFS